MQKEKNDIENVKQIALGKEWKELNVHDEILNVIQSEFKFTQMTPVQENTIPLLLQNKDVVVEAITGSGKTLAFLIPVFEMIMKKKKSISKYGKYDIFGIIICPTRELASQIFHICKIFEKYTNVTCQLLIGGTQPSSFQGEIAIGTPGRLLDVIESRDQLGINLSNLEILILDEADRILDLGFETQLNRIIMQIPKQRRTGLFSATQTSDMKNLIRTGLRNPVKVSVSVVMKSKQATPLQLENFYMIANQEERFNQFIEILKNNQSKKIIVYFLTCACVDYLNKILLNLDLKLKIFSLHGQMVPKKRERTYSDFTQSESGVLLCTDIAARGLDISGVEFIIQYDPPVDPSVFIHRVGRTARMGKSGTALVFLSNEEEDYVEFLKIKNVPIQEIPKKENVENYVPKLREMAINDRDVFEKAETAFISFVRAYKEHHCNYIFNFKKLNLNLLAKIYILLRKPKRRLFKGFKIQIEEYPNIDNIPYLDKKREEARLQRLEKQKLKEQQEPKKEKIKEEKKWDELTLSQKRNKLFEDKTLTSKNRKRALEYAEEEQWKKEERLLKKVKRGKITEEEYEKLTGEEEFFKEKFVSSLKVVSTEKKKRKKKRKKSIKRRK